MYVLFVFVECDEYVCRWSGEGMSVKAEAVCVVERDEEFYVVVFDVSEIDLEWFLDNDLVLLSKEELIVKVMEDVRLTYAFVVVDGCEMKIRVRFRLYFLDIIMMMEVWVYSESDYKWFCIVCNVFIVVKGECWFLKSLVNLFTFTREWLVIYVFLVFFYVVMIFNGIFVVGIGGLFFVNVWSMFDGLKIFVECFCNDL